jgi:prephenate dehydrogenase
VAEVAPVPRRVAFLGLGLIGGSIARAVRRSDTTVELVAWTPDGRGPAVALRQGVIAEHAADPAAALEGADLVVLAGPAPSVLAWVDRLATDLAPALAPGVTITDVASTKAAICARAAAVGLPFAGGHPMAGRDAAGFAAGDPDLFVDRPWVVDAGAPAPHAARIAWLAAACGARLVPMDPAVHDAAAAGISHLPLVVAAALVESVFGPGARAADPADTAEAARLLAASGWRDTTRLARGDPAMGAGILATNAPAVARRLRALRAVIDAWIEALEADGPMGPSPEALAVRLAAAREALLGDEPGA